MKSGRSFYYATTVENGFQCYLPCGAVSKQCQVVKEDGLLYVLQCDKEVHCTVDNLACNKVSKRHSLVYL